MLQMAENKLNMLWNNICIEGRENVDFLAPMKSENQCIAMNFHIF